MMFGLTAEKLLIIGTIAAFIIGPQRLPFYAAKLAALVRQLKNYINEAQERIKDELGPEAAELDWKKLDPRRFDPRQIVKQVLLEAEAPASRPKPASANVGSTPTRDPGAPGSLTTAADD